MIQKIAVRRVWRKRAHRARMKKVRPVSMRKKRLRECEYEMKVRVEEA